jgi:hypothetical protein
MRIQLEAQLPNDIGLAGTLEAKWGVWHEGISYPASMSVYSWCGLSPMSFYALSKVPNARDTARRAPVNLLVAPTKEVSK